MNREVFFFLFMLSYCLDRAGAWDGSSQGHTALAKESRWLSFRFSMWPMAAEHGAGGRHLWAPPGRLSSRALMFIKMASSLKRRTQNPATSRTGHPLRKDNQVTPGTDSAVQVVLSSVWRCRKSPGSPNARRGSAKARGKSFSSDFDQVQTRFLSKRQEGKIECIWKSMLMYASLKPEHTWSSIELCLLHWKDNNTPDVEILVWDSEYWIPYTGFPVYVYSTGKWKIFQQHTSLLLVLSFPDIIHLIIS